MKNVLCLALLAALALVGCEKPKVMQDEIRDFKVVEWKTSKHTWVRVADSEGTIYKVATGKYCDGHKLWPVGARVDLRRVTYEYESDGRQYYSWLDSNKLCRN